MAERVQHSKAIKVINMDTNGVGIYRKLAENGNAEEAYKLAWIYYDGMAGADVDAGESLKWLKVAAELGHVNAQTCLGWAYDPWKRPLIEEEIGEVNKQTGLGWEYDPGNYLGAGKFSLTPDREEAAKWYGRAAEQGYAYAQHHFAWMYHNEGDKEEAFRWFVAAAEQDYEPSQRVLGALFSETVETGLEALARFKLDAENGDAEAACELGDMYDYGRWVARDTEKSREWFSLGASLYLKAAEDGDVEAQYRISRMYRYGLGIVDDLAESAIWLMRAAENGNAEAQNTLAEDYEYRYMYQKGPGRYEEYALMWFRKAAEQGNSKAQYRLGWAYDFGELGLGKDPRESFRLYSRAAEDGDISVLLMMADKYERGLNIPKDKSEAFRWFLLAANKGDTSSRHKISEMYRKGAGVEKNAFEADKWHLASEDILDIGDRCISIFTDMFTESLLNREKAARNWKFTGTSKPGFGCIYF